MMKAQPYPARRKMSSFNVGKPKEDYLFQIFIYKYIKLKKKNKNGAIELWAKVDTE